MEGTNQMIDWGTMFNDLWIAVLGLFNPVWALIAAIVSAIGGGQ